MAEEQGVEEFACTNKLPHLQHNEARVHQVEVVERLEVAERKKVRVD